MNGTTKRSVGALTVLLAVFGGVVLLGTGATAAVAGAHQLDARSGSLEADAEGVNSLDMDVSAADVRVEFRGSAADAELRIEQGSTSGWSLTRDGDELTVRGPRQAFELFRPDWVRGGWFDKDPRVTLVLPESLEGLDADLTLNAGALAVDGAFDELGVRLNAGSLTVTGETRTLTAQLNAGNARIDLDGVRSASYTVNAGKIESTLRSVPDAVDVRVAAGRLELLLPDAAYDLRREESAGTLRSSLREDSRSEHRIRASVTAGTVVLEPSGFGD
ncbi:hypothetical protein [Microbacterium soli]|uniref:Adhesin domain-containing protein n=1 Tax=Microbacterium soli TaxID=446075 RepID=A0ABP7N279_9MICO